jgi:hypothetical protein
VQAKKTANGKEEENRSPQNMPPNRESCFQGVVTWCLTIFPKLVQKIFQKTPPGIWAKKTAQGKEEGNLAPKNGNPTKIPILKFKRSVGQLSAFNPENTGS